MKKLFAIFLAVMMVVSMATVVSAAENTTTLTTTVPDASYTLNVPKDQVVDFGTLALKIGNVTITNSSSFAAGKNVEVTFDNTDFSCPDVATTIPIIVKGCYSSIDYSSNPPQSTTESAVCTDNTIVFEGQSTGVVNSKGKAEMAGQTREVTNLEVAIKSTDWAKALGGEYTATITFTAEVVVE